MNVLTYPSEEAKTRIAAIVNRTLSYSEDHERAVMEIIQAVQNEGDAALLRYTRQFDSPDISLENIRVSETEMQKSAKEVEPDFTALLQRAKDNISCYHEAQQRYSWFLPKEDGSVIGQMVRPVAAAGLYIPGGRAGETPLISSLLMNAIPAITSTGRQHQPLSAGDRPVPGNQRYFQGGKRLGNRRSRLWN
jgi:histidinol dehydrogenase